MRGKSKAKSLKGAKRDNFHMQSDSIKMFRTAPSLTSSLQNIHCM